MPTTEPVAPAAPSVSSLVVSISSNEAKILALERRMAGHDSSKLGSATGNGGQAGRSFSQFPSGPTSASTLAQVPATYAGIGQRQPQPGLAGTPPAPPPSTTAVELESSAPAGEDAAKRRRTNASPQAATGEVAAAASPLRPPLSDITPSEDRGADRSASVAHAALTGSLTPVNTTAGKVAVGSSVPASGAVGNSGGAGGARSRKRKQQDPRHDPKGGTSGSLGEAAGGRARGTAAAAAAAALAASLVPGGATTPLRALGGTDLAVSTTPVGLADTNPTAHAAAGAGGKSNTPLAVVRHLFDGAGVGGRCRSDGGARGSTSAVSAGGGGGGGGRGAPQAESGVAGGAPPPPSSAQKRSILSYYPPVLGHGGGGGAGGGAGGGHGLVGAGVVPLVPDQSSRDGLPTAPQSLLQQAAAARLQQQLQQQLPQQPQVEGVAWARTTGTPGSTPLAATMAASASSAAATAAVGAAQLQQCQQQVAQLQAQVIQVQAAMAAQQAAAGAEIERLRRELEARSAETASLQERCRTQEAALQQAVAGEAAARAELQSVQSSSASEAARWAAEAAEAARVAAEREGRYRAELARVVQLSARLERDLSRSQLSGNAARLGSLTLVRTGPMQMAEVWEDGTAFQQLATRRAALAAAKEEVLAAQKLLRKRLAPPPSGARSSAAVQAAAAAAAAAAAVAALAGGEESTLGPTLAGDQQQLPYMSGQEFVAADEVYKTRLSVLKREEEAVREEEDRLNREKFKQIRSVKLSREEDGSRFGRWPVLPDRPGPTGQARYVLMNLLGKGGFSEVFKAYDLAEARHVCVKIHALTPSWPSAKKESYVRHAIREYDIHRSLRHPAVVGLLDVLEIDLDTFATVLELCEGGDLDGVLREHRTLPEREARCLMSQIFSGLRYLAARRVIHYDLKPANILFDSLGQAKITDFGLSKLVTEGQTQAGIELTSQGAGTYWYLPPEAFETGGSAPPRISNKVDVWSAGVVFYSMLYGKKPYGESMSQEQMLRERVMAVPREVEFPARPAVSADAKDFIRRCLAWHQDHRPDVEAAATDPYLTGGPSAVAAAAAGTGNNNSNSGGGGGSGGGGVGSSLGLGLAAIVGSRR